MSQNQVQPPVVPITYMKHHLLPQSTHCLLTWLQANAPEEIYNLFWSLNWGQTYIDEYNQLNGISPTNNEDAGQLLLQWINALSAIQNQP